MKNEREKLFLSLVQCLEDCWHDNEDCWHGNEDCSANNLPNTRNNDCAQVITVTWLVPLDTAAISGQVLCAPYNHASSNTQQRLRKQHPATPSQATPGNTFASNIQQHHRKQYPATPSQTTPSYAFASHRRLVCV